MSFRKRSEVIEGNPPLGRGPVPGTVPGRVPGAVPGGVLPLRGPMVAGRGPLVGRPLAPSTPKLPVSQAGDTLSKHCGIKPSILTSQPTTSTGSLDLDRILGHQGLPMGCSLLIEENGTTDFSTVILKKFAAEGVVQNRIAESNTHVIVIGQDQVWGKTLPGLYKGSSRDQKKLKILENESKLSIANLNDQQQLPQNKPQAKDLKIAWRYGLLDKTKNGKEEDLSLTTYPDFIHQFDITSTLIPAPNPTEISYVPLSPLSTMVKQIESIIAKHKGKLIRLVVPNLLHPLIYPLQFASPKNFLQIISAIRLLTKKYNKQLAALCSINLDLYPRDNPMVSLLETQLDGIIELKPFQPALYELMEKVYQKEPKKIKHGFVNIIKIPVLSDLGMMLVKDMEYCFKNGKKNFDIEEWSIPVDEETGVDNDVSQHSKDIHLIEVGSDGSLKGQTVKDIEF